MGKMHEYSEPDEARSVLRSIAFRDYQRALADLERERKAREEAEQIIEMMEQPPMVKNCFRLLRNAQEDHARVKAAIEEHKTSIQLASDFLSMREANEKLWRIISEDKP
jgi:hypothetical protein